MIWKSGVGFIKVSLVVIDGDRGTDAATNQVQQYLPVQSSLIGELIKNSYSYYLLHQFKPTIKVKPQWLK